MAKPPQKIVTVEELVAKSVFEKEFAFLKTELEKQQSLTWQVVIGVGIAFVLAVGVLVADTMLSRNTNIDTTLRLDKEINDGTIQMDNLSNKVDNIMVRNPYLK